MQSDESPTPPLVNLNGRLLPASEARVSVLDHGLLYGDGLFETLRVYGGRFFRLEAHLERLARDAIRLELRLPWPPEELAEALRETVAANGIHDGAVRLTVTRGEGPPVPDPGVCPEASFFVTAREWTPPGEAEFERGLRICVAGRHPRAFVPGIKSLCYLPFQQARHTARKRGCDDGLLTDGELAVETSVGNLFLVCDGELVTPDLQSGCLPGITRAVVLELAVEAGFTIREEPVPLRRLEACEELFTTGSLTELLPVVEMGDQRVGRGGPGPVTRRLRELYRARVEQETTG